MAKVPLTSPKLLHSDQDIDPQDRNHKAVQPIAALAMG
jgi:hypothetical protein